jgi:hypothetical protein
MRCNNCQLNREPPCSFVALRHHPTGDHLVLCTECCSVLKEGAFDGWDRLMKIYLRPDYAYEFDFRYASRTVSEKDPLTGG